uniref:BURP domain-containing protein n=1 Tax=Oryza glumipatula TaxID=40148 RepID=A0A0D9ZVT0_9ORYZ
MEDKINYDGSGSQPREPANAASPAEMYWKIALPTSPMPGAIRDLISPAPGKVAVCHFLPQDDMLWVRN